MDVPATTAAASTTSRRRRPPATALAAGSGAQWWGESWRIFCAAPGLARRSLVVFIVLSMALMLIPVVGGLVHAVLTPVFAGGVMLGCHALATGRPLGSGTCSKGSGAALRPALCSGCFGSAVLFVIAVVMVATVRS